MFKQQYAPRNRKAEKIKTILFDFLGDGIQDAIVLDLGCSDGVITQAVSQDAKLVYGVEIDENLIKKAHAGALKNNLFALGDGAHLPFLDESFDIVVCAQVYEHAEDQHGLVSEVWRVLRADGVCFLSGPNRLAPIEEHYWLPFLSWLPQWAADNYLKLSRRGSHYEIKPLLYWQLKQLCGRFKIFDYTPRLVSEPERFNVDDELGRLSWSSTMPLWFWKAASPLLPNFNWILQKNDE
jgi:SAM-dependent methyltransferase